MFTLRGAGEGDWSNSDATNPRRVAGVFCGLRAPPEPGDLDHGRSDGTAVNYGAIVANITPHEAGLKGWTEADFIRALREGKRKDGTDILPQMPWKAYGQMKDVELKAPWAYLQTVPAIAKGIR